MNYRRMPIEVESPEERGYGSIACNLAESSCADLSFRALGLDLSTLVLQYHDHRGHLGLRELVAGQLGVRAGEVITTVGAAAALFMIATTLLGPDDHLVVVRPNYATNIETPRAIGCAMSFVDLRFEDGWTLTAADVAALLRPNTRMVSLTCPHNPTGALLPEATLREIAALCEARGIYLLCDETYRDMTFGPLLPSAVSLSPRALTVSSLSKTYGLPGIRIGWLACRDQALYERLLAAKEQIFICNSILDEEVAFQALSRRDAWLPEITARIAHAFGLARAWMAAQPDLEWVEPRGGVVGFPRIREPGPPERPRIDVPKFYATLEDELRTVVGPGHWFEQPDSYFRLGYGWPTLAELEQGLTNITTALKQSRR